MKLQNNRCIENKGNIITKKHLLVKREPFFVMVLIGTPIKPRKGLELLNDIVGDKNRTSSIGR